MIPSSKSWNTIITILSLAFLVSNIIIRVKGLLLSDSQLILVLGLVVGGVWIVRCSSRILSCAIFLFAMGMAWAGFQPYHTASIVFELLVAIVGLWILLASADHKVLSAGDSNDHVSTYTDIGVKGLVTFVVLSALSLWLLPLSAIVESFIAWDRNAFLGTLLRATPQSYLYPIAALNRLILFVLFVYILSRNSHAAVRYQILLMGLGVGTAIAALIGILDYHNVLSLNEYRPLDPIENPRNTMLRLQSVFGHPGWFAEYATTTVPLLLVGLGYARNRKWRFLQGVFIGAFIITEYAILQAKARGGWIANFVTLALGLFFLIVYNKDLWGAFIEALMPRRRIIFWALGMLFFSGIITGGLILFSDEGTKPNDGQKSTGYTRAERSKLSNRIWLIFRAQDRIRIWKQGIAVGLESPLFGMGYETFAWHKSILKMEKESFLRMWKLIKPPMETPHNLYIQQFVNTGIVGLTIYLASTFLLSMPLLTRDIIFKKVAALPTLLAIINFHVYGLVQSMNYVPTVWLLIFILFGNSYVLARDRESHGAV